MRLDRLSTTGSIGASRAVVVEEPEEAVWNVYEEGDDGVDWKLPKKRLAAVDDDEDEGTVGSAT